jgi:hypothetical protein
MEDGSERQQPKREPTLREVLDAFKRTPMSKMPIPEREYSLREILEAFKRGPRPKKKQSESVCNSIHFLRKE